MKKLSSILAAIALGALAVGPVSAATAPLPPTQIAQNANDAAVSGTVKDDTGAPIPGARVQLRGRQNYSTTTDSAGTFSLDDVAPGVYLLSADRAGYDTATEANFAVVAGQNQTVAISMHAASFSSLRTIATVRSNGRGQFNTTPAAVNVVSAQTFVDQAQPQVIRVLNQIPGVSIQYPESGGNGATAGSITYASVRGASSYETAVLIDGHPLATGDYGDFVTSFLNSYLFGSVEVVKGPGADSPVVNSAIGGTINFRTFDPTLTATPSFTMGADTNGGTFSEFGISDTIGRLGFVARVSSVDDPSPLNGHDVYIDPTSPTAGSLPGGTGLGNNYNYGPISGTSAFAENQIGLVACCYPVSGDYSATGELIKFRYKFSNATTATVSYLGGQAFSDQNGNLGNITNVAFEPSLGGPGYTGPIKPGTIIPVDYIYVGNTNNETDNEPIFQAEVTSTVGPDTVLARYYHATIQRIAYEGSDPFGQDFQNYTLNGVSSGTGVPTTVYNNVTTSLGFFDYFRENELDYLAGLTFEYTHPFGPGDDVSFSVDQSNRQSVDSEYSPYPFIEIPGGSAQLFTTYLLRTHLHFGDKLTATLADYENTYRNTFVTSCPLSGSYYNCSPTGSGDGFTTTNTSHNDPRLGLVYQPASDLAVRASAGSSIAPPYLYQLSAVALGGKPEAGSGNYVTITAPNPNLVPETAFGYDLGADYRTPGGFAIVSADAYLTDLYNHYFTQTAPTGLTCADIPNCPAGSAPTLPLYTSEYTNLSNSRYEGVELTVKHTPEAGLGFSLAGGLQHAYAYDLPGGFYCSVPLSIQPCTKATYNQNLNIIPYENFNAGSVNSGSIVDASVPYFQGNAEISYTTMNGIYAMVGDTFYGNNNSFNVRPFGIGYATIRVPLNKMVAFQVSGDNIFNANSGLFPMYYGGRPIPLANGTLDATTSNVLGPAVYRFMLTANLP